MTTDKLLARIRAATGPDRMIDRAIHDLSNRGQSRSRVATLPEQFTARPDAIDALIDREFGGSVLTHGETAKTSWAKIEAPGEVGIAVTAATPALARCAAYVVAVDSHRFGLPFG